MKILLSSGIGSGPTHLAAFDSALNQAGIANYNLIKLSSVIPAGTKIVQYPGTIPVKDMPGTWGDRLYIVMAERRTDTPFTEAWAGIGWVQDSKSGRGLFVEHDGNSEEYVRESIQHSLEALMDTRHVDFGQIHMKVVGTSCSQRPVCALVAAVYQASDWDNQPRVAKTAVSLS